MTGRIFLGTCLALGLFAWGDFTFTSNVIDPLHNEGQLSGRVHAVACPPFLVH